MTLNNYSQLSTFSSSYYSLMSSLSESSTAMNTTLSVSLSLTSSSSDEEMSSLVHKIFLKAFFLVHNYLGKKVLRKW
jgi:hypothetical protein